MKEERRYHAGCHLCRFGPVRASGPADARRKAEEHERLAHKGKQVAYFGWHLVAQ